MNFTRPGAAHTSTDARSARDGGRPRDAGLGWSTKWSGVCGPVRSGLRTTGARRPPRHDWDQSRSRRSLWQLTYLPPTCEHKWVGFG